MNPKCSRRLLNRDIPRIHKNSACVYSHPRETCDVTNRSNDSQMHISLSVPCQSVSHNLVRYNGSENRWSTTRLLCSSSNLAFSLPLYFFFSLFLLELWSMAALPHQRSFTRFGSAFHEHQVRLSRKGKTNVDLQSVMEKWERLQGWVSCWLEHYHRDTRRNTTNSMNDEWNNFGIKFLFFHIHLHDWILFALNKSAPK